VVFAGEKSGEAGRFETKTDGMVSAQLPPGSWKVEAALPGYRPGEQAVILEQDHACEVIFNLLMKESVQ
jgi:hypothetical protein